MSKTGTKAILTFLGLAALASQFAPKAHAGTVIGQPTEMSPSGVAFLKNEEGFSPRAFKDGRSPVGVQLWSIGYGHQLVKGDGLTTDSVIDDVQATELLKRDLKSREKVVRDNLGPYRVSQNQFNALVSFAYNIGNAGYAKSEVARLVREGKFTAARDQWTKNWTTSEGRPVLLGRRQREANLFASG
jgi:lysozyme